MHSPRFLRPVTALCFLATAACGSLSGKTDAPSTLASIHGTIQSQSATAGANLSTAIVWFQQGVNVTTHESADSVPVTGSFPASFTIDLNSPPPAEALMDLQALSNDSAGAGIHIAFGLLVAYDDRNHNGQLDLVSAGASDYVDSVEGTTFGPSAIFYVDKPIPDSFWATSGSLQVGFDGSFPSVGYNFLVPVDNYCYRKSDAAGTRDVCALGVAWKPIDTPATLTLGDTKTGLGVFEQTFMCASGPTAVRTDSICTDASAPCAKTVSVTEFGAPLPSADDQELRCLDSRSFFYHPSCKFTPTGVCADISETCAQPVVVTLDPSGGGAFAPPADWPCALQPPPAPAYLDSYWGQPHDWNSGGNGNGSSSGGTSGSGSSPSK
jgi:hypothetical protein